MLWPMVSIAIYLYSLYNTHLPQRLLFSHKPRHDIWVVIEAAKLIIVEFDYGLIEALLSKNYISLDQRLEGSDYVSFLSQSLAVVNVQLSYF